MAEEDKAENIGEPSSASKIGIPAIEFIDDIDVYMKRPENENSVEVVLKRLEEAHQKYKMMEATFAQRRSRFRSKLPDLKNSLELLEVLAERKGKGESMTSRYMLSDACFSSATIPPTDTVCLWLGANVMLEYSVDEARHLLVKNITGAEKGIVNLNDQLDFIKDQLTTTEVNIARCYNWGVNQRKSAAEKTAAAS